jgi:predicted ATPase/DNA-binding winged helix-turn-helix (wHTH) protein
MAQPAPRQSVPEPTIYRFGGYALDPTRGVLQDPRGAEVGLRPKAAEVLRHLIGRVGRVVSREELLQAVWPEGIVTDDSISQCVFEIRQALGEEGAALLRTLPKRGYLLAAKHTRADTTASPATPTSHDTIAASSLQESGREIERRLAAVLAADVAGYSRLMSTDEEGTHRRLSAHRRELVEPCVAHCHGRIVKHTGDGFLAEFASVVAAVRCALALQHGMAERDCGLPSGERIEFRVGINLGDVIVEAGDIFGDGVNIAARLEGLAAPGSICLSQAAYEQVRGRLEFEVQDLGEQRLRNIDKPVQAYSIPSAGSAGVFQTPESVSFGPFSLYARTRLLEKDGAPVKLGSRALDILRLLVSRAGEVVPKNELLAHAWPGLVVEEINLRVHIAELRKALGDGKAGARYVENVPSRGYCFVAPVQRSAPAPAPAPPAPKTNAPASLPHRLERMVGREDVLQELSKRLLSDRFVTLRGPGGVGKTTVAVALAHDMRTAFDGQVHFLDLGPLKDAALVTGTVASALGLVVHHADPTDSIINFLRDRHLLLVLDCCEHVIETVARLAESIHQQASGVSILATSRESLLVEGEQIFELVPLQGPPQGVGLSARQVLSYPAARLFMERAAAAGHRTEITDADADVLVEICDKLDGIALAIELAAARVGTHGLQEIATLLDGRLKLEWRGRRTAPPRHQTLGAALDWSYGLIVESERVVLRRLAVFAGPFTLQDAAAVAGEDGEAPDRVVHALEQLVTKSLVSAQPEDYSARYRLLDTTKAYAMQKLADCGEATNVACRHARYVQHTLEATATESSGGNQAPLSRDRAELLADARAALTRSYMNDYGAELRVPLAAACSRLFVELNLLNEACFWASRALAVLDDASRDSRWELELQSALGHASMFTGRNSERCEGALRRGLDIAEALGDNVDKFRLLARLNMFYRRTGEYRNLVPIALEAERIARVIGDAAGIAGAKALVGVSYHLVGDQRAAQLHLDEGMSGDAALRDAQPGHFAYSRTPQIPLARVLWLRGFPDRAIECVRPLTGAKAPRDVVMHCVALCWSATLFGWIGDWAAVASMASRLAAYADMHGLVPYQAVAAGFRAQILIAGGELAPGVELLRTALPRLHADRYELYASAFAGELSQGLAEMGQPSEGLKVLHETIARVAPEGAAFDLPELLRLRGELEARSGNVEAAEASLAASIALAERQGALSWRLRTEMTRARLRRQRGTAKPFDGLTETYARFSEGFETHDLKAARRMLDESSSA